MKPETHVDPFETNPVAAPAAANDTNMAALPVGKPGMALPPRGQQRILAGFMPPDMFRGVAGPAVADWSASQRDELWARHAAAIQAAAALAPLTASRDVEVPFELAEAQQTTFRSTNFQQSLTGGRPFRFSSVAVEHLGAFQGFVKDGPGAPAAGVDLTDWCLPQAPKSDVRVEGQSNETGQRIVVSTSDPNVTLTPRLGADVVGLAIGRTPNWVQVAAVGGRYLLRDGHHRVAASVAAGHDRVPAIVVEYQNWQEAIAAPPGLWFTPDVMFGTPRPPLVADFLDSTLTLELPAPSRVRVYSIQFQISKMDVAV